MKADPNDNKRNETMYFYADTDLKAHQLVGKGPIKSRFREDRFCQSEVSGH